MQQRFESRVKPLIKNQDSNGIQETLSELDEKAGEERDEEVFKKI